MDVLDGAALDVDALLLEAQPRLAKNVREELLQRKKERAHSLGQPRRPPGVVVEEDEEERRTSACMSLRPPRNLPMGVRSEVTICARHKVSW